ncbi:MULTISPECIES: hypothetical protein [Aerococcus]|uniref:hypothetical protein n=1 Tax=Aerococcus urinae (strain CCUG 59500 / ACS-120-V-Col10a) TaxID=2976812 RepID=UPI000200F3D9|nr:hypothetical protein [Aerococcus sp. Group 1]AEA01367.1 hypothetical protein HMPREF9243_1931 [Aerococcus sp. Group 1]MCY3030338.1 hypothetical protein [Aerococcus sp. Group 1]MCY3055435.1 hypothetical protein [Aerococcus sp. Group 1]MCY3057165.1 hypothetical protein [Aerococcus sp. Group 1]MCY3061527.1 hypothetical protein [Aerococcus sp. Group 1]
MNIIAYMGFTGIVCLAVYAVLVSFKPRNIIYQFFLQGLWTLGLLMTSLLPLALILKERPVISSLFFWASGIIGLGLVFWGACEAYKLFYDLIHGSLVQSFQVTGLRCVERSLPHGGDYYLFETSIGMVFEVDYFTYRAMEEKMSREGIMTALVHYCPKTKIIVALLFD